MIKVLLDTNVILDIALKRPQFYEDAAAVFQKMFENKITGYISASSVTDIFYILKRAKIDAFTHLKRLLKIVDILNVDKGIILFALYSGWFDFEDAVQAQIAVENEMDIIITRNTKDYQKTQTVKVFTPRVFIEWLDK